MKLSQILSQVNSEYKIVFNEGNLENIEISDIEIDSRRINKNSAFFALKGITNNAIKFVEGALEKGASVIIASEVPEIFHEKSSKTQDKILILCDDVFALLVEFLQIFYHNLPQNIYAITGTNGKTSSANYARQILKLLGKKAASIGTLGVICDYDISDLQNSSLTTPDIVCLYKNLAILKAHEIDDVVLEASSIALEQKRLAGLKIKVAAFTNFTQDHLDYHKEMSEYFRCKTLLFSEVLKDGVAILNADIAEFEELKNLCQKHNHKIIDYGFKALNLQLSEIKDSNSNQIVFFNYRQNQYKFEISQSAHFQVFNVLCALACVLALHNLENAQLENLLNNFIKLESSLGRMQKVAILPNKAQIFIDFAHSPDALENVLKQARKIAKNRLIILFGCGGNRDRKKRPIMGKIACELADLVIVSDDNPRLENAALIRAEIIAACDMFKTVEIANRKDAIIKAIKMLEVDDILILAGKGHEKYQIIGEEKINFDEEEIVKLNLAALNLD
jgi:UDP-N-acetylmuramoyl-L-alanyl-D-glutamate--2,6-diaminopimelate ligase